MESCISLWLIYWGLGSGCGLKGVILGVVERNCVIALMSKALVGGGSYGIDGMEKGWEGLFCWRRLNFGSFVRCLGCVGSCWRGA